MPIYVYECEKCGNVQEELQSMKESKNKTICNKCKSKKMKKIPTTPGMFLFAHKIPKSQFPN